MKHCKVAIVFAITVTLIMATEAANNLQKLNEANNQFTKSIYSLLQGTEGNIFFSPLSIETVLSLVHAGAAGRTASQVQKATFLQEDTKENGNVFKSLSDEINAANENVTLNFVNGLYADKQFSIKPEYLSLVKDVYQAEMNQVDFQNNPNEAEKIVNSWVANKTNDKIPQLFSPGSLDQTTKLVLLNAIYFKGDWLDKFPEQATKKGTFHLNQKDSKEIDFMSVKASFRTNQLEDCTVVELPYKGESVSMIIIVPKDVEGLAAVEAKYVGTDVSKLVEDTRKRDAIVTMPKFKLEHSLDLKEILEKLGITDLFKAGDCDVSGISDEKLYVSKAIQKAFIEVNEKGSEAAAVTGFQFALYSLTVPTTPIPEVKADRPFLFYVVSNEKNVALFTGRFVK